MANHRMEGKTVETAFLLLALSLWPLTGTATVEVGATGFPLNMPFCGG